MKSSVDLHPLHLKDLRKSGLSDETIEVAGFKSVPPNDIKRKLGFDVSGLVSTYEIPYDKTFSRFRCFYMQGQNGRPKLPKYLQKKVAGNRLYIPGGARAVLNDPSVRPYIAEGEKKALKASQEGLVCIAISGLWNWSKGNKELIPDFDKITMKSRDVYIVPDNDYLHPNKHGYGKNLAQAVHELAHKLKERGARVFIIELPQGDAKGLDDYLCTHTVEEFQALPITEVLDLRERVKAATKGNYKDLMSEIADEKDPIEREMLCKDLASVLDVSLRIIKEAVNKLTISKYQSPEPNGNVIIFHPAYHVEDNLLLLGFRETVVIENKPEDRNFYLLAHPESYTLHTGNVIARGERNIVVDERDRFLLRAEDRWPKERIMQFLENPQTPYGVYSELKKILRQYIEFPLDAAYGLIAAWTVATYFHLLFHAFPFLFIYGKKQTGKSRALDLLERLCFSAMKVKGISVASMADSIDGVNGTFLNDQAEALSDTRNVEILGILADSYTQGGGRRRIVDISNKRRRVLEFATYAPKAFASIKVSTPT